MKIDERLYQEEIKFCSKIAARLGYEQDVLFELMLKVKSGGNDDDKMALKQLTKQYLRKG
jgi:hypothetical protein